MKTRILFGFHSLLALGLTFCAGPVCAKTLLVWEGSPSPSYPHGTWNTAAREIQTAVDAAVAGDTVLVAWGDYDSGGAIVDGTLMNRVAVTNPIIVQSVSGAAVTTIHGASAPGGGNGDGAVRCVYLGANAQLIGFTLTNGYTRAAGDTTTEQSGGGVWCGANAYIGQCVIGGNSAEGNGGGVFADPHWDDAVLDAWLVGNTVHANRSDSGAGVYLNGGGTVAGCVISNNAALGWHGGGVACHGGGLVTNCLVTGNRALPGTQCATGGGIYCDGGVVVDSVIRSSWSDIRAGGVHCVGGAQIRRCTIVDNETRTSGGGVVVEGAIVENCVIVSNRAAWWIFGSGGGLTCWEDAVVRDCLIADNTAVAHGGGVQFVHSGELEGCTITENSAGGNGGGVAFFLESSRSQHALRSCLIAHNMSSESGGGISTGGGFAARAYGLIENCTVASNTATVSGGGIYNATGGTTYRNTIVRLNSAPAGVNYQDDGGLIMEYSCTVPKPAGAGNTDLDPQFRNVAAGDYRLVKLTSPCIGAGLNQGWMAGARDLIGTPRIQQEVVDMGAYECGPWDDAVDLGNGWLWLAWFGLFNVLNDPLIQHLQHDSMYVVGRDPASGIWFFTWDQGWLWTNSSIYPWLFRQNDGAWCWYSLDTDNPRWVYNLQTGVWEWW